MTTDQPSKVTIPEVVARFAEYYRKPGNGAWGSLHIVLDDGNHDNDSVAHCIAFAIDREDKEGEELARILLTMTRSQRGRLPRKVDEYLSRKKEAGER